MKGVHARAVFQIAAAMRRGIGLVAVVLFAMLAATSRAMAQAAPEISVHASAEQVETEEPFTVELKALVVNGTSTPRDPELHPPHDFSIAGPSVSTQMMVNSFNGGPSSVRSGIGATWQLVAHKPGKYVIPGPSVVWDGRRVAGPSLTVVVVKGTGRPRPQQPQNPFLFPGGPGFGFPWLRQQLSDDDDADDSHTNAELSLPQAPDPAVFLHATVDKKAAVIGEQITYSVYLYVRSSSADIRAQSHDAPFADFLRMPLLKNPGTDQAARVMVGGKRWWAKLLDRVAIFGVRSGDLHTGSHRLTFARAERASEDQIIHVTEPPTAGRPAGYALGDVGRYTLAAEVKSRKVDQGGSVSVVVTLSGTGNLPHSLRVPERTGVEWLEPEQRENIEPQGGAVAGFRTFGYVVRVTDSGHIDLGDITLPYWDPIANRYQVARASVGGIDVVPAAPSLSPRQPPEAPVADVDPLAALPSPRTRLAAFTPSHQEGLSGGPLWFSIAAPPVLVSLVGAGARISRRLRAKRASAKRSPAALAKQALNDAAKCAARGDRKALASSVERALHFSVEAAVGLRSRGVLLSSLVSELNRRGISMAVAERVVELLSECDVIGFVPISSEPARSNLLDRARAVIVDLEGERP